MGCGVCKIEGISLAALLQDTSISKFNWQFTSIVTFCALPFIFRSPYNHTMLEALSEDIRSFYACSYIKRLYRPSALEFMRECVSSHQPCIIEGLIDDWSCMTKWSTSQGFLKCAPTAVDVNFTPDGRADSVQNGLFMTPAEVNISTKVFMEMLESPQDGDAIPYLSAQNDNLRDRMPELLAQCASSLPLADEIFGSAPEAVNLWVGDERSVSSTHKDFFENMYCVVRGTKTFTLFPPPDIAFLPSGTYSSQTYGYFPGPLAGGASEAVGAAGDSGAAPVQVRPRKSELAIIPAAAKRPSNADAEGNAAGGVSGESDSGDGDGVRWIWLDPDDPDAEEKHPAYRLASPLRVEVRAGEVLYLPALWLHRVSQTCLTIAINFWYDMKFDLRYVLLQTAIRLAEQQQQQEQAKEEGSVSLQNSL